MKKIFVFFCLLSFLAVSAIAQEDYSQKPEKKDQDEIKTLFKKGEKKQKPQIGYYIGPEFAYTQFTGNKNVFLLGLSMGVTVNRWFGVGLSGYGIVNSGQLTYKELVYDDIDKKYKDCNLFGGYGGLNLEFTVLPKSPVHVTFPVLIGVGGLTYLYFPDKDKYYYDYSENIDWDIFFLVQPGVRVEFNVVKFFRIGVGASYRYVPDLNLINTSKSAVNQFNANLSLKFGKF
ncbi:MAG: hypothetical protein D4R67_03710 [Bacteroidetes bacterium]|nr:MAG: hypothetical protein D4R67_03710 [Bacteroidota bacterium]